MSRCIILLLIVSATKLNAQVKKIGLAYTHIPKSSIYMNDQLNTISVSYLHAFVKPYTAGISLSWGWNTLRYRYLPNYNFRNSSPKPYSREAINYFSGQQVGLSFSFYHRSVDRKNIRFLPGLAASTSFFTKSFADFATIKVEYLDTQVPNDSMPVFSALPNGRQDHNYNNLRNPQPDLFMLNLLSRVELKLARGFDMVLEPFLTVTQINKHGIRPFGALGLSVGSTWTLPVTKTERRKST
jgi:hypothetical protein